LVLNVPDFKEWAVNFRPSQSIEVVERTRAGYVGPSETRKITFNILKLGDSSNNQYISVVGWVDQILEGGEFERFVSLIVDGEETKYRVKRIGRFVYADLSEPVGGEDKYSTRSYLAGEEFDFVNVAEIYIDFEERGGVSGVYWLHRPDEGKIGWHVKKGNVLSKSVAGDFYMPGKQDDFYGGLLVVDDDLDQAFDYDDVKVRLKDKDGRESEILDARDIGDKNDEIDTSEEHEIFINTILLNYNRQVEKVAKEPETTIEDLVDLDFEFGGEELLATFSVQQGGLDMEIPAKKILCGGLFTRLYFALPTGAYPTFNNALIYIDEDSDGKVLDPTDQIAEQAGDNWRVIRSSNFVIEEGDYNIPVQEFIDRIEGSGVEDFKSGVVKCGGGA